MLNIEEIKKLRSDTYAPMLDCKNALEEANGDMELAKEILKKRGKGEERNVVPEAGRIVVCEIKIATDATLIGMAVVRTETDFVANSPAMLEALKKVSEAVAYGFLPKEEVEVILKDNTYQFGEKILLGEETIRLTIDHLTNLRVATYVHFNGRRAAWVKYKLLDESQAETGLHVAQRIATQCVAMSPKFLSMSDIDQSLIDGEIQEEEKTAISSGKPPQIAHRIAHGKVSKRFEEIVLLQQTMFDEPTITVDKLAKQSGIELLEFKTVIV